MQKEERPALSKVDQERARLQEELKRKLIVEDTEPWAVADDDGDLPTCRYVAGLDVSYEKDGSSRCCAALVIFDTLDWKVLHTDVIFGQVSTDYAAGFLAFREIDFLMELVDRLKATKDIPSPSVWLVDGNGIMHPRGLGLASHFGVLIDQPTVGVSKNPYFFDDHENDSGLVDRVAYKQQLTRTLIKRGDRLPVFAGPEGASPVVGVALKVHDNVQNPLYVSIGHRVSLETAIAVVLRCCRKFKNPEPVRQADMISREELRKLSEKKLNS